MKVISKLLVVFFLTFIFVGNSTIAKENNFEEIQKNTLTLLKY